MQGTVARAGVSRCGGCRILTLAAVVALTLSTSGCETINPITLGIGVASYVATGKGLADHALGALADKDCNIIEGLLSLERRICEPKGSPGTQGGFRGLLSYRDRGGSDLARIAPKLRLSETWYDHPQHAGHEITLTAERALTLRLSDSITPSAVRPPRQAALGVSEPPRRVASL